MKDTNAPDPLKDLVGRTEGLQPLRRLFHAFNGCVVAGVLTLFEPPAALAGGILGGGFLLLLLADFLRLRNPGANALFFRAFTHLASPREAQGVASSTWYSLGLALCVLLFPLPAAVSGILVLALADPAASYLGRRWGRRPFLGGSVEGTTVFLLVALAIMLPRHPPAAAVAAAFIAALAERKSWPLDDNLTVPVVTAGVLTLAATLG